MTVDNEIYLERQLNIQTKGAVTLLDAVSTGGRDVSLFFQAGTPLDQFEPGKGLEILDIRSIGNGPVLRCRLADEADDVNISVGGQKMTIGPTPNETDLFAGMNVIFAVRNGENPQIVAQWLQYHVEHHAMEGALILNRARPGTNKGFGKRLRGLAGKISGLKRVVILDADVPLGKPDLPAEAHPINVPGAPGKDRMKVPKPEPWAAPLGELTVYELVRARFLSTARAVANVEVYDLIACTVPNVFDRACDAPQGLVSLEGSQIYPWRVRKNETARFGDHICVQFDAKGTRGRWCVAPAKAPVNSVWRLIRVVGAAPAENSAVRFFRHMSLRHPNQSVSKIVPKTSLIEDEELLRQAVEVLGHNPVRMPEERLGKAKNKDGSGRTTVVTTMKNEGPFILEWIAYHRAIGVTDFLVYTNDCTDGTDTLLEMLQEKGILQHRQNPFKGSNKKPQHAALEAAEKEPVVQNADWIICMDVDEFINIHVGEGRMADLFGSVSDANMISLTWRLFGNSDTHLYRDDLICETFTRCAPEMARKPHQAWGFKTLFRNQGIFKKLGVHRPKGLKPQLWGDINWVNGSGAPMPHSIYRNGWRSTVNTFGYGLVSLNHYAVRSAESFLVKRDRGRVNHVDRDQGLSYWFRMNNNAQTDHSIQRMLPALRQELEQLMADKDIASIHHHTVKKHRAKIDELQSGDAYAAFYNELVGARLQSLSRMHDHFGANVFLMGPGVIPDEIAEKDVEDEFFFTVEKGDTNH